MKATQSHITARSHPLLGEQPDGYTYIDVPIYKVEQGNRYASEAELAERMRMGWEKVEKPHPSANAAVEGMTVIMRLPTLVLNENLDNAVAMIESKIGASMKQSVAGRDPDINMNDTGFTYRESTLGEEIQKLPDVDPAIEHEPLSDEDLALADQ